MSFTLTFITTSVILPSPEPGNIKKHSVDDIRRLTRGGDLCLADLRMTRFPMLVHIYKFVNLTNVQVGVTPNPVLDFMVNRLKAFLKSSAGKQITITDHLSTHYTGYILSPEIEIIAERPVCSYDFGFEFMETPHDYP